MPASEVSPEPVALDLLFEDDQLLVVNKLPAMLVHPSVREHTGTLMNGLLHHAPDTEAVRLPPRPDRDTSGLMVVTKTARGAFNSAAVSPSDGRETVLRARVGRERHKKNSSTPRSDATARSARNGVCARRGARRNRGYECVSASMTAH